MRSSERKLSELESNIRPNRHVALAMTVISFVLIGIMLLNEFDVFRVVKARMRLSVFLSLAVIEIALFAASTETGLKNRKTKYVMLACAGITCAIVCIVLSFHATLILILPLLLASQYPSAKVNRVAVVVTVLCAVISPVVSYLMGMWDSAFLASMTRIAGVAADTAIPAEPVARGIALRKILLYLSLPHALIMLASYPLSISIARSGEERLKNQLRVLHMSESDALTGLLNRMSFDNAVKSGPPFKDGNVAVVYVDANDLHRLNNEQGHAAGDKLLICVADSLLQVFDGECVFRIGGDEFVSILYGLTLSEVRERVARADKRVRQNGYSISVGIEYAQLPCTLPPLITAAETKMMIDKERYHITR